MHIKVSVSGCVKCKKLVENVRKALEETVINAQLEKVTDMNEIAELGVMITLSLVTDDEVVSTGKVLIPNPDNPEPNT